MAKQNVPSVALERGNPIDLRGRTWEVFKIMAEFVEGYQFLSKYGRQVTVFGSARTPANSPYYKLAVRLGALLAKNKFSVITGGGPGLMEAANKGAFEAGGTSLGLNILLPHEQRLNPYVRDSRSFFYFLTRKVMLTTPSLAFVYVPGGFGTLDELFEVLDQMRYGQLSRAPVILVDRSYWQPLVDFLQKNVFHKINALAEVDLSMIQMVDTPEEALEIIKKVRPSKEVSALDVTKFSSADSVNWRVFRIMAELVEGFEFLRDTGEMITILGTPRVKLESRYYKEAYQIGRAIGKKRISVVTGGGGGIMEAANKGAHEVGSASYGMDMLEDHQERRNEFVTRSKTFYFPFTRKLMLTTPSRGFVLMPGGYGTLNLCFEILTLIQTGKIKKLPIVLYGKEFWEPLLKFIKENQFEREHTVAAEDLNLYKIADSPAEAIKLLGL